jgi:hypothetical protein
MTKAAPGAGSYTVTAHLRFSCNNGAAGCAGLVWRQSSNGTIMIFGPLVNSLSSNNYVMTIGRPLTASGTGTSPTYTAGTDRITIGTGGIAPNMSALSDIWLQITDDRVTNRTFLFSLDGQNWITLLTQARTTDITPDEYGTFVANLGNGTGGPSIVSAFFDSLVQT